MTCRNRNSIILVKDSNSNFFSSDYEDDYGNYQGRFNGEELQLLEKEKETRPKVNAILEYFQGREKSDNLLLLFPDFCNNRLDIGFKKDFVEHLCKIPPEPFLQIRIDRDGVGSLVDKQFPLQHLMNFSKDWEGPDMYHEEALELWHDFEESASDITITVTWNEPAKKVQLCATSFMQALFEEESSKDLTLVAGDKKEFKCHRNIFAAHGEAFSAMLSAQTGMQEARSGRIEMSENTEDGLEHLLKYIYGMELTMDEISRDVGVELFQTAHKYGLTQLENSLQELFYEKDAKWFTPDILLQLYFYVKNLEVLKTLRDHLLFLMARMNPQELLSCEAFMKLNRDMSTDVSIKLIEYWQNREKAEEQQKVEERSGAKRRRQN